MASKAIIVGVGIPMIVVGLPLQLYILCQNQGEEILMYHNKNK